MRGTGGQRVLAEGLVALLIAAGTAVPALDAEGAGWGEPHLVTVPRTGEEATRIEAAVAAPSDFTEAEDYEARPGGATSSVGGALHGAFSQPSANLRTGRGLDFELGRALFEKLWVAAPSATRASDGLGPLYNARSCASCHVGNGRGHPPDGSGDLGVSMVLKLSVPDSAKGQRGSAAAHWNAVPEPAYGWQVQDKSVAGMAAEGRPRVDYTPVAVALADGTVVELRRPEYLVERLAYGPMHPRLRTSARIAPPMIGLGLLEAIPEADILAGADPSDADGNGISGRANRVWSREHGQWMLGRFGWKAGQPTVEQQASEAFAHDMGLSTPLHPAAWGECTSAQGTCRSAPHGESGNDEGLEIPRAAMDLVTFYARNLSVPARREVGAPEVLLGKRVFHEAGCASCHQPAFVTHRLKDQPEQSFQLIYPYSDLLLHDMGPGLADGFEEAAATGKEWRTAPLWGIGMTAAVAGDAGYGFLHDGRARTLLEAILWHGGEAFPAREAVRTLPAEERAALLAFLNSL
ncbi:di-heme oxidoredictase family protein [Tropicimonas isoalkanivorans]|uniref:CxxC motif-containing protein, DUF1111 family n=1 Tax=Tropicimonas isoalkanivorans TaxID=441112 RepID=A0A1I1P6S8_9RHOB|nr:di-heme oxidoredictase family protein [Tropicimonas isoalkanivorans]SFD05634.1 CxxC motif-containing protein, DUF1111 family [Tropicimonas isoalkanivorans]